MDFFHLNLQHLAVANEFNCSLSLKYLHCIAISLFFLTPKITEDITLQSRSEFFGTLCRHSTHVFKVFFYSLCIFCSKTTKMPV